MLGLSTQPTLGAPELNGAAVACFRAAPNLSVPCDVRAAVEDNKMRFIGAARVGVVGGLRESDGEGFFEAAAKQFKLDDDALHRSGEALLRVERPFDEQVGAFAAQAVFAADAAAAVDYPLQEGLQQQLRARFFVVETFDPGVGMFAEKLLESGKEFGHIQTMVGSNVPGGRVTDAVLSSGGELARQHFAVQAIGDRYLRFAPKDAEPIAPHVPSNTTLAWIQRADVARQTRVKHLQWRNAG